MSLPPTRNRRPTSAPRWLGLAGPTAAGKSAAALAIAEALAATQRVEIVSVDSALVYRGMDIGTAKPTPSEQAQVPHHLIDILDPTESYSAARFVTEASQRIDEITRRGRLPLLVGGTMLYFKALIDGIDAMPAADAQVRAAIEQQAAETGWPALHAELAKVDPLTASRLAPADSQRIQRALEVFRISGAPLSSFHHDTPTDRDPPTLISLEPENRAWLHDRIARRFETMLTAGLIDEVQALRRRGDIHAELPSMRCVGYRQVWQALDANDLSRLEDKAVAATRQLAKRQITWLRAMPWRQRVACDSADAPAQVATLALAWAHALT